MAQLAAPVRTSLERSCFPCIRGKRRCDKQLPSCSRCLKANRICSYTNQPVAQIQSTVQPGSNITEDRPLKRQRTVNDDEVPSETALVRSISDERHLIQQIQHLDEHRERQLVKRLHRMTVRTKGTQPNEPVIVRYEDLGPEERLQLEQWRTLLRLQPSIKGLQLSCTVPTIRFTVSSLRLYPILFRTTGRAPFIHPMLAGTRHCEQSDTIFKACFATRDENLHHHINSLIGRRPQEGSLDGLLTAIQALLIGLMALLFSDPPTPDTEARRLLHTLATWTQLLYDRLPQMLPLTLKPWEAWVFAESVRRTILMSHLLINTYSLATTGSFLLTPFYTALPFDGRTGLWDNLLDPGSTHLDTTDIISFKEYTEAYEAGQKQLPADVRSFETLLTVACTGFEAVLRRGDIEATEQYLGLHTYTNTT